jgi:hypothetical protein
MKWWKFKEKTVKMFKERVHLWMKMSTCIRKVASGEFGVTKGGKRETKEIWW